MGERDRTCKECGEELAIEAFGWHSGSKGFRLPRCKECEIKRRRAYMAKRAAAMRVQQMREQETRGPAR